VARMSEAKCGGNDPGFRAERSSGLRILQTKGRAGLLPCGLARETQRSGYATQLTRGGLFWRMIFSENRYPLFGIMRELKQIELHGRGPGRAEVLGRELRLLLVEAELLARDLEASADHPGVGARSLHAPAPGRVVVLAAAHLAHELEHVAIAVGII